MTLVEHVLGFVGALINTPLLWLSVQAILVLTSVINIHPSDAALPFLATVMKLSLKFEGVFKKLSILRIQDFSL